MKSILRILPAAVISFLLNPAASSAQTVTYTFQDGVNDYAGTADTNIYDDNPTKNYGADDQLYTRYNSNSSGSSGYDMNREGRNILIAFDDIDTALSGRTVTSASITLTVGTVAAGGGESSAVLFSYELLSPWNEGTGSGSSGTTGTANWDQRLDSTSWETAGAQGSSDRNQTPINTSDSFAVGGSESISIGDTITIDIPASIVQAWIDNGSTNNGILISVATTNQYRYPRPRLLLQRIRDGQ